MPVSTRPLGELADALYQGASITRYRDPKGSAQRVVNIGDLQHLQTQGRLEEERLTAGNYLNNALKSGDLAIATRGTILKAAVVTSEHVGAVAGQNLAVLRPSELVQPLYSSRSAAFAGVAKGVRAPFDALDDD